MTEAEKTETSVLPATVPQVHPPSTPKGEAAFKVCELFEAEDGVHCRVVHILSSRVYTPPSAIRYAAYEAKYHDKPGVLLAVVSPAGRLLAVLLAGSGRRASTTVMRRVRRLLHQAIPEVFASTGEPRKRRTSRPTTKRPIRGRR